VEEVYERIRGILGVEPESKEQESEDDRPSGSQKKPESKEQPT